MDLERLKLSKSVKPKKGHGKVTQALTCITGICGKP